MIGWMDHMWNYWGMGWGMWFWVITIIGLGYLFFIVVTPKTYEKIGKNPLEVAQMRLAKGEITPEEYEKIKNTLESSS